MKEVIVSNGTSIEIIDSPIPIPQNGEVLIRVIASGCNPKDCKQTLYLPAANSGDDIAGVVEAIGGGVFEFKPGDHVAAFHQMYEPHGSFAEYAIAPAYTTFHKPTNISFEEATTIPLAFLTAAVALYHDLQLPYPWAGVEDTVGAAPLLIYGAGTAVGNYALQLAQRSNLHPIICVAGQSTTQIREFMNPVHGDVVIDYRLGAEQTVSSIKHALGGKPLLYAFDAVSDHGSDRIIGSVISPEKSRMSIVQPRGRARLPRDFSIPETFRVPALLGVPDGVDVIYTSVGRVHSSEKQLGFVFSRYISQGIQEGWFRPHPHEVMPGGLYGVGQALENLHHGQVHFSKYVFRIGDTEGISG
ncbi:unnamed protein product [Clonostachys byssicola]|uniref:Enoyl reductase (ER) domain-containing protein n=1 Tax=Clonostachys byssicola TaxID=160290 RepID=A0A9N9U6M4_9HYPO|nr:unnamed protein product [Clonostachys byssicola]